MYPLTLENIIELISHKRPQVSVGTLPLEVRKHFGRSHDVVVLSAESAKHILTEHGEHIGHPELLKIPQVLEKGMWISENDRPEWCIASFFEQNTGTRFLAAIKVTKDRKECFLASFYKVQKRQIRSKMKRGHVLRNHW